MNVQKRKTSKRKSTKTIITSIISLFLVGGLIIGGYFSYGLYEKYTSGKSIVQTNVPTIDTVTLKINEATSIPVLAKNIFENFPNIGLTTEEIISKLNSIEYLKTFQKKYSFLTDDVFSNKGVYALEGLLYPANYEYYTTSSLDEILDKPFEKMQEVFELLQTEIKASEYTFYEILTLASIVEAEAFESESQKMVAQIFVNRLDQDMPIGSDATLVYYLQKSELTLKDFENNAESPYNTRSNIGLTPTPIRFVTEETIDATLNRTPNDYLYFLTGTCNGRDDYGKFFYANTYEEHQLNYESHMVC